MTVLRTVVELEEQTSYGEELVRGFIRVQLKTAVWLAAIAAVLLCGLPVLFFFIPAISDVTLAGVRLPWLLLGWPPSPSCSASDTGTTFWPNGTSGTSSTWSRSNRRVCGGWHGR
ncbi:hypothetical protein GCM10029964_124410 [Kibdelosporangium lantanae]